MQLESVHGADSDGPETPTCDGAGREIRYESNRKHSEPWQRGRRGSLCPKEVRESALELLKNSELDGDKRYAVHQGRAYCARQHSEDAWHGYPVGWVEVPEYIRRKSLRHGQVSRRDIRSNWS